MKLFKSAILISILLYSGCTYRFSNQYLRPPTGVKTAYIEAAYDTSGFALNHQILTKAFEDEIAKDGKLILKRNKNADQCSESKKSRNDSY